jgi:hypothetical protein
VSRHSTDCIDVLVRRNRDFFRQLLLDGLLVADGYLDRAKTEEYLAADEPFMTVRATHVLLYSAAEIWLQKTAEQRRGRGHSAASALRARAG